MASCRCQCIRWYRYVKGCKCLSCAGECRERCNAVWLILSLVRRVEKSLHGMGFPQEGWGIPPPPLMS